MGYCLVIYPLHRSVQNVLLNGSLIFLDYSGRHVWAILKNQIYSELVLGSHLFIIQKKVSLLFIFLFIFMLYILRGQADPLVSDF